MTSEVNRSNTLDDIGDNELFKSSLEPAADTGKSFSEALILASTNPYNMTRLFIELQVKYMKIASSEHVSYIKCSECQNKKCIFVHNMFCNVHVLNS